MVQSLSLSDIPKNSVLADDLYSDDNKILLTAGTTLTDDGLQQLRNHGVEKASIRTAPNEQIYRQELFDNDIKLSLMAGVDNIFCEQRIQVLDIDMLVNVIKSVVEKLSQKKSCLLHLIDFHDKNDELSVHSINVSVFSILLGISMGLAKEELCSLGIGGLLHDLGKVHTPPELLNKPARLTTEEFDIVKNHVPLGYSLLRNETSFDHRIGLMVLQHHERCNGKGYPWGLREDQIHQLSHIVSLADVYEALTANRAYRTKFSADKAIDLVNEKAGTHFSAEVVKAFNQIVVPYNIGETVKLSNGQGGKVIGLNSENLRRPQVFTALGKVDLLKTPRLNIIGTF